MALNINISLLEYGVIIDVSEEAATSLFKVQK